MPSDQGSWIVPPTGNVIVLDPNSPFAGLRLIALMVYPRQTRMQQYMLTTMAGQLFASVEEMQAFSNLAFDDQIATIAERQNVSPEEILSLPGVRELLAHLSQSNVPAQIKQWIEEKLFKPAGGHSALSRSPGADALSQSIATGMRSTPGAAGLSLVYCACMQRFHPTLNASLSRSLHIVAGMAQQIGMKFGTGKRSLSAIWPEWGHVAPIWAGAYINMAWHRHERRSVSNAFGNWNGELKQTLAYAAWFREFATSHVPSGASGPILSRSEALILDTALSPETPPLRPLSERELQLARAHRI